MARKKGKAADLQRDADALWKVGGVGPRAHSCTEPGAAEPDGNSTNGRSRLSLKTDLKPALKDFIDHVIVPILVRDYLGRNEEKQIADKPENVSLCNSVTDSPEAEASR